MITKSDGFGNCGNKIYTNFGENAFDKVNLRGNYRIATLEYNTTTSELTINQYPDVSKTVILGESGTSRNAANSHKDVIAEILDWANMGVGDFNNLAKDKNYVIYNANNPSSERYMYYTYDKSMGEWTSTALQEGDEFYNLSDDIKYRYVDNKLINAVDVVLSSRNTVVDGKSTGIELTVYPSTKDGVHIGLVDTQYAGLMSPEDKSKLNTIGNRIGSVLELGNPKNGSIPLYLKNDAGEILSTVQLDEDDYIDNIESSIATEDDPAHGIKTGDKILIFTLTNGRKTIISLEKWFTYYTGDKTNAISTEVLSSKIKSTLLIDSSANNLSRITTNGLLTELLWKSGNNSVKFIKGAKSSYDSTTYSGYIYFATDTKEVIVDGVAYGIDLTAQDLELVKKITETDTPGKILVTKSNGATYEITIPVVSTTKNGLMKSTDKAKLDGIESGAQVNIIESVLVNNTKQPISNKTVTLDVYNKAQVNSLVSNGIRYKGESTSVANLPILKETGDAYRITVEKQGLATGAVVFWDGDKWATFTGNLDLSNYATKQDLENQSDTDLSNIRRELDKKVDKIDGKQLSTNDFSNDDRAKSANLSSYLTSAAETTILGKINLNFTSKDALTGKEITQPTIILSEATTDHNGLMSSKHYDVIEGLQIGDNYLDKTGTPSSTWQLSKNTGPKIKNSGGQFELRNANDDTYADLIVKDITITGNVTQEGSSFITKAETVEVTDNTILLNKGEVGAGVTKGYAGLEIDRGTLPLYKIYFDESDDRFKAGSGTDLWPIMLRDEESTLTDKGILTWDSTTKRAKTAFNVDDLNTKYIPYTGNFGQDKYPVITGPLVFNSRSEVIIQSSDGTYNSNILSASYSNKIIRLGDSSNRESIDIEVYSPLGFRIYSDNHKKYGKIWTELYQGTGTGLDADLLDGQHGSYYAKASDLSSYIPLAGNSEDTPITGLLFLNDKSGMGIYGQTVTHLDGTPRHVGMSFENNNYGGVVGEKDHSDSFADIGCSGESWYPNAISQIRVGYKDNAPLLIYRTNPDADGELHEYNIYHEGNLDMSQYDSKYVPLDGTKDNKPITGKIQLQDSPSQGVIYGLTVEGADGINRTNQFVFDNCIEVSGDTNTTRCITSLGCTGEAWDKNSIARVEIGYIGDSPVLKYINNPAKNDIREYNIYHEGNLDVNSMVSGFLPLSAGEDKPLTNGLHITTANSNEAYIWLKSGSAWWKLSATENIDKGALLIYTNGAMIASLTSKSDPTYGGSARFIWGVDTSNFSIGGKTYLEVVSVLSKIRFGTNDYILDINTSDSDIMHYRAGHQYKVWDSKNLDITKYALKTDLDKIDLSGYLPLSGGKMTGNITIDNGHPIYVEQEPTSNYSVLAEWRPGGERGASIGCHNTGGDGTGAIVLVPFNASYDDAHTKKVGLYIGKNELLLDGNAVALTKDVVTLTTAQTISGTKTFTAAVTGTNGFYDTSDIRLKSNIKEIELSSQKIKLHEFDKNGRHSYGVIAQEVEELYPLTVQDGEDGYKTVNYNEVLIIKCAELEAENKALKDRLDRLEQLLTDKGI